MTKEILAFELTVTCANGEQHNGVELAATEEAVTYTTSDGLELKGESAVQMINSGNFLVPLYIVEAAIRRYKEQS